MIASASENTNHQGPAVVVSSRTEPDGSRETLKDVKGGTTATLVLSDTSSSESGNKPVGAVVCVVVPVDKPASASDQTSDTEEEEVIEEEVIGEVIREEGKTKKDRVVVEGQEDEPSIASPRQQVMKEDEHATANGRKATAPSSSKPPAETDMNDSIASAPTPTRTGGSSFAEMACTRDSRQSDERAAAAAAAAVLERPLLTNATTPIITGPASTLPPPPAAPSLSLSLHSTSTKPPRSNNNNNHNISLRIPSHAVIKVIKGEIHNVLTMMRATDQRYVSRSRFLVETTSSTPTTTTTVADHDSYHLTHTHTHHSHYHPVAQALQDLHAELTTAVEQGTEVELLQQHAYLEAFCQAIQGQDISAPVTGAALSALHKFVLYGFVCDSNNSTSKTGMTRIAQALLECRFEESGSTGMRADQQRRGTAASSRTAFSPQHHPAVGSSGLSGSAAAANSSSLLLLHHHPTTLAVPYDDEQTVLKLLDVAALTVRTSLQDDSSVHLMDATTIVRLLDACLHVSHRAERASPLLKSAAASALSQIVLQVFAGPGHAPVMQARREILAKLASLLNPKLTTSSTTTNGTTTMTNNNNKSRSGDGRNDSLLSSPPLSRGSPPKGQQHHQSHQVVVASSLTLVNIALETCREPLTMDEIHILQNDLCKYLLQWSSTTHDLMLLSLTLRVIFNLFQSIRNHLKVPLEVFLTSVHLRILNDAAHSYSPEEKEVALESLVEFCQEPALMQDIFLNYDCDVACTNLYEAIVTQLGRAATPMGWKDFRDDDEGKHHNNSHGDEHEHSDDGDFVTSKSATKEVISKSASISGPRKMTSNESLPSRAQSNDGDAHVPPVTHLQRLGVEGLLAVLDSIAKRCQEMRRSSPQSLESFHEASAMTTSGGGDADVRSDDCSLEAADEFAEISSQKLHERKLRKQALDKVARVFNAGPMKDAWIKLAIRENLFKSETNAKSVAEVLYIAPNIDKAKLGIYLSKGPDNDYPFLAAVREAFVELYDFSGQPFAAALRRYLSKFRLPGEAQCIDRLMEAFSKKLYSQQDESMFKNSDAIYVLAFSTIMLNTDLHNPTIKQEQRMTQEQFVRNNRGINGGDDLPADFLKELYDQIKENEIQVRRELGEFMKKHEHEDFRTVWDNMLSKKGEVATPFFTPTELARSSNRVAAAGFHDKEMFIALSKSAVQAFSGIFLRSWDDALVVKALDALRTMVRVAAFLGCDSTINDVLEVLLAQGRDYIVNCIATDYMLADGASLVSGNGRIVDDSGDEDDTSQLDDAEQPIPYGLLCSSDSEEEVDITGSAAHRGLLAMDCAFVLMRKYSTRVVSAWPAFVECLCFLRDARALPRGLSDLDDFADSSGNILPLSSFAKTSQKRLVDYYRSQSEQETQKTKGWFGSFFRKKSSDLVSAPDDDGTVDKPVELSAATKTLAAVAEAAGVENVIQMGSTRLPDAGTTIQSLLDCLDAYPYRGDPVGEQHAIFALELAARALLSNKDRATELFVLFLVKFEGLLANVTPKKVPAPFVIERIVVTILRCCIHLYEIPELRPNLRAALHLFFISLPKTFIRAISDRMACGLAIILRASFHFFETHNDWTFMGDTLDMLAHFTTSRVFVFDGIASVVEYALPPDVPPEDLSKTSFYNEDRPSLSNEACGALSKILIRFVLGFYQGDLSLTIPAVLCLEKIYRYRVEFLLEQRGCSGVDPSTAVPDKEYWQNIAVAMYTVCRSPDPELSCQGVRSFQRIVLQISVDQIPDEKWLDILFLMVSKQPPLAADLSRGNTFSVLGQLLVRVLPKLSHSEELRDDLVDLIHQTAQLARENLRHGRRGSISPLFEKTLQAVTYLANHMMDDEWKGESEFGGWASETLLAELERVGAAGAALPNQKAVKQQAKPTQPQTGSTQKEQAEPATSGPRAKVEEVESIAEQKPTVVDEPSTASEGQTAPKEGVEPTASEQQSVEEKKTIEEGEEPVTEEETALEEGWEPVAEERVTLVEGTDAVLEENMTVEEKAKSVASS